MSAFMKLIRWRALRSELPQVLSVRADIQAKIATFQQRCNPAQELTEKLGQGDLHIIAATEQDNLANTANWPRIWVDTNMTSGAAFSGPIAVPALTPLRNRLSGVIF